MSPGGDDHLPHPEPRGELVQAELDLLRAMGRTEVVGSAEQVADGLDELAARFGVREMIISTRAHGMPAKLRSMELIAGAYSKITVSG